MSQKTTARQLASVIKSARDIMRKDKGLSSDVDRLPMLTWILFLKFLDDMEQNREVAATLQGKAYRPIIEAPYRWRDWATDEGGITGDALLAFVNYDEATRPDGTKGLGLFAYLRSLQATPDDPRPDVVATIFRETFNRMRNGYLLRDVINKVNGINFASSEEMHTLSLLYETMLKEMRDAAGNAGEFYTPRPVVKLMVKVTDPHLGEVVEDPACGTGGFLVEAYEHLYKQAKTVQGRETLQQRSIRGGEAKALPYLLGQMNLLLHGLEAPQITYGNSLSTPLRDIGPRQRVDVILTNPPFGGEEEAGIQDNFPKDKRTSETALLFLQLIMRKLRRTPKPGRAAVVVPNGTLFADGVAARIKEQLLKEFSLHTIVRLPRSVFSPYTPIATNLLFFELGGPIKEIWYYEHPMPEGRSNYTKTKPLRFSEFKPLLAWWNNREEGEYAWKVGIEDILKYDGDGNLLSVNLDISNPNTNDDIEHRPPRELITEIVEKKRQMLMLMEEIEEELSAVKSTTLDALETEVTKAMSWPIIPLGEVIEQRKEFVIIDDLTTYKRCRVQVKARGIVLRDEILGLNLRTKKQQVCQTGEFLVAEIDAKVGGFGIVPEELDGAIVSSHYFLFVINETKLDKNFLEYYIRTFDFQNQVNARGSTNYASIRPHHVLGYTIPLPPLSEQRRIVTHLDTLQSKLAIAQHHQVATQTRLDALFPSILDKAFNGEL